jgi:hypothetical protein
MAANTDYPCCTLSVMFLILKGQFNKNPEKGGIFIYHAGSEEGQGTTAITQLHPGLFEGVSGIRLQIHCDVKYENYDQ